MAIEDISRLQKLVYADYGDHYQRGNVIKIDEPPGKKFLNDMNELLLPYLSTRPAPSKMIDVGCGTGHLLYWAQRKFKCECTGVDLSAAQIEAAGKVVPDAALHLGDAYEYLRDHPNTFDLILCFDLIEHIPGDDNLLDFVVAARNSLTSGGSFICRTPNGASLLASYSRYLDLTHQRVFTSQSIIQLLRVAGFSEMELIPIRVSSRSGKLRRIVEDLVHKGVYKLAGRNPETIFTSNVVAAASRE